MKVINMGEPSGSAPMELGDKVHDKVQDKGLNKGRNKKGNPKGLKGNTEEAIEKMKNIDVEKRTPSEPDREFCNRIEIVCDRLLKANKLSQVASIGIPGLVQCADHKDETSPWNMKGV